MKQYLESSQYIDWDCPEVLACARACKAGLTTDVDIAESCFEYVRDTILHTSDYKLDIITAKASDVLSQKTGYCYAKSHLLAALLRANQIPAGLCYQRLSVDGDGSPYSLHGLNAVFLQDYGWYRIDARGNKAGVNAEFTPPVEKLAWPIMLKEETDIQGIWHEPLPSILAVLKGNDRYKDVNENLPDVEIFNQ